MRPFYGIQNYIDQNSRDLFFHNISTSRLYTPLSQEIRIYFTVFIEGFSEGTMQGNKQKFF